MGNWGTKQIKNKIYIIYKNKHIRLLLYACSFLSLYGNMRGKRQKIFPRRITIIKKEGGKWVIDIDVKDKKSTTLNGVYETISELIGFDNAVKIYESFRGSQVNFPTRLFSKEFVLQEAIKAYDGTSESVNLIAIKYNYSERTVRKLLKENLDNI